MSVNTELSDRIIDHAADVRRYEEALQSDIQTTIDRHKRRLRKQLEEDLKSDLRPEVKRFIKESYTKSMASLKDLAQAEADFQVAAMHKSVAAWYKVDKPSNRALTELVGKNIRDGRNMLDLYNGIGKGHLKRANKRIREGIREGHDLKDIVNDVSAMKMTTNQATALTRTAITKTQTGAAHATYEANSDIITGYRFVATLDSRTSRICSHNDGLVFSLTDQSHIPPLHFRCRSTTTPVVKKFDDIRKIYPKIDNLSNQSKRALDGKPPKKEDYQTWLSRQSIETKLKHLGDMARVNLFDKGKIELSQFTNRMGQPISLTKLRRLDNRSTDVVKAGIAKTKAERAALGVDASTPTHLMRSREAKKQLRDLLVSDAYDSRAVLSTTDYRGALITTKFRNRYKANNTVNNDDVFFDPLTGERKSKYLYDPDFSLLEERLAVVRQSTLLTKAQKAFIDDIVRDLDGRLSTNQRTVVVENLRLVLERYAKSKEPWSNLEAVLRAEMRHSVTNVSRRLETRTRQQSKVFSTFVNADEPQIQILGENFTFKDLATSINKDRNYIQEWENITAKKIARGYLVRKGTPLRTFFDSPKKAAKKKDLLEIIKIKLKLDTPEKIDKFIKNKTEQWKGYFTLERKLEADKVRLMLLEDQADLYSRAVKMIAEGLSTDYDALSVSIGKMWREHYKTLLPFWKPGVSNYRRDGARFLDALEKSGAIRIVSRGVKRDGVVDLDTGRPSGSFFDTNSRQIEILDPRMLEYQKHLRKVTIAERIGYTDKAKRYHVVRGEAYYRDAFGRKTTRSVVTRQASQNFDPKIIDRDFTRMLNHTMSVEYEVDDDFSDFMLRVANFRDTRGNVQKWDELNSFRKVIIERGEQGYGFTQTVKFHRQNGKPFTVSAQIDGRGRVYYTGYLTPTGGEVVRPFLNTHRAKILGENGFRELRRQIGAMLAEGTVGLTEHGRLETFRKYHKLLIDLGDIMTNPTQRDRRVRDFLTHPLIIDMDGEEVAKLARMALEVKRVDDYLKRISPTGKADYSNLKPLNRYYTKLMVENDASASGAQIIALTTKNRALAELSNVVPTEQKQRLYDIIAMRSLADPRWNSIRERGVDLTWEELAKASKAQNMVAFYGAGKNTQVANVVNKLSSILNKDEKLLVISKDELANILKIIDGKIRYATNNEMPLTVQSLKNLRKELVQVVNSERPYSSTLMREAADVHNDVAEFVAKLSDKQRKIVGPDVFRQMALIMSDHLKEEAPITEKFIEFWKTVARTYIRETGDTSIPWVTFDGKKLRQHYQTKVQHRIDYKDPRTGRTITNIVQVTPENSELLGTVSEIDARTGLGVNGNHANDAAIVRRFHLWGRKRNIDTATIHDAFFTNIADADDTVDAIRGFYGDALDSDSIGKTLAAMRKEGLSYTSYINLRKEAKRLGLLDGDLSRDDVMRQFIGDELFYGVGP